MHPIALYAEVRQYVPQDVSKMTSTKPPDDMERNL
jgi:hypothetical protein